MIINTIKNLLFDNRCFICASKYLNKRIDFICNDCLTSLMEINYQKSCAVCGHPLLTEKCPSCSKLVKIYFDRFHFIQYYNDFTKSIIYKLKISGNFIVIRLFYKLICNMSVIRKDTDYITVVPDNFLSSIKKGRSGLNYLIFLFKIHGYKTLKNIYKRKFLNLQKQKSKNKSARFYNISQQYYLPKKNINKFSGRVFLIDDIFTTGATLNYGSKLLKKAGFDKVFALSIFRAVIRN